jgi:hypothetical protein
MRLVVLGLLLTACTASLEEVREGPPVYTGEFARPYRALVRCVYDNLDAQTGQGGLRLSPSPSPGFAGLPDLLYYLEDRPGQLGARVNAMISDGPLSTAMFEITVQATAAGASHVEYRRWSRASRGLDQPAWAIVTACGQAG